jgi:hypothetical protein
VGAGSSEALKLFILVAQGYVSYVYAVQHSFFWKFISKVGFKLNVSLPLKFGNPDL